MKKITFRDVVDALLMGLSYLYCPIYLVGWVVLKIARLILVIGYLLTLKPKMARDILKNILHEYDWTA